MPAPWVEHFIDRMFGRPITYTTEDIRERGGKLWLEIQLGGRGFLLPGVNAGTKDNPLMISWFNPDPAINPELSKAAARSMAELLRKLKPRLIVTPPSSKSGQFIAEAARQYNPSVRVITLLGGDDQKAVQAASAGKIVEYLPVTRLASGKPKYLGMSVDMRRVIMQKTPNGYGMVIAEDVTTTGNTLAAMMQVMDVMNPQIAVIARESELNDAYPPRLETNLRAVMHLPEIRGFNAAQLYPIEPKAAIPAAIPL